MTKRNGERRKRKTWE